MSSEILHFEVVGEGSNPSCGDRELSQWVDTHRGGFPPNRPPLMDDPQVAWDGVHCLPLAGGSLYEHLDIVWRHSVRHVEELKGIRS